MAEIDSDSSFRPLQVICKKEECGFCFDVYLFKILIQDFNCKCPYCGEDLKDELSVETYKQRLYSSKKDLEQLFTRQWKQICENGDGNLRLFNSRSDLLEWKRWEIAQLRAIIHISESKSDEEDGEFGEAIKTMTIHNVNLEKKKAETLNIHEQVLALPSEIEDCEEQLAELKGQLSVISNDECICMQEIIEAAMNLQASLCMGEEETELHNIPRAQVLETVSQHISRVVENASRWKQPNLSPEVLRVLFSEEDKKQERKRLAEERRLQRLKEEEERKKEREEKEMFMAKYDEMFSLHESRIKEIHKQYKEEKEDEKEILEEVRAGGEAKLKNILQEPDPAERSKIWKNSQKEYDENIKKTEKNFEESNKKLEVKENEFCKKMIAVIDEKLNCLTGVGFKSSEIEKAKEMLQEKKERSQMNNIHDLYNLDNAVKAIFSAYSFKINDQKVKRLENEVANYKKDYEQVRKENNKLNIRLKLMTEEKKRISTVVESSLRQPQPVQCSTCRQPMILLCSESCEIKNLIQSV